MKVTCGERTGRWLVVVLAIGCFATSGIAAAVQSDCEGRVFDSTYDLLQEAIFENRGCTNQSCHGSSRAGGLDLRAGASYDSLVEVEAQTVSAAPIPGLRRVVPGQKDQSLLFLNLAAATLPDVWDAPLRAMPIGLPGISLAELEAVREWIEQGAPRGGTVPGTGELLDACLPPPMPIEIEPLPVPAPDRGLQVRMPQRIFPAGSESEVCFASYYDVSGQVPAWALSADGQAFRYKGVQVRQDPLSHHLFVDHYAGGAAPDDPAWGRYRCRGGVNDGASCEPTNLGFCAEGLCGSEPIEAINCLGFGPPDAFFSSDRLLFSQEASTSHVFPGGVFKEMPLRGLLIWNSHAFNLTEFDGKLEAWLNFEFAASEQQISVASDLYNDDRIFAMEVPAFAAQEVCGFQVFPPETRVFELSSHTHRHGKRFRIYEGRFACDGGPRHGEACSPQGSGIPGLDLCAGAACASAIPPAAGDCDGDGRVGINDLTIVVRVALGRFSPVFCRASDPNQDGRVTVSELVQMVNLGLAPAIARDPAGSLLYTNLVYSDPTVAFFEPPLALPGHPVSAAARTFTYCALYDNGFTDPSEVKRQSTSPPTPPGGSFPGGIPGGPCDTPTGCTEGLIGVACSGESPAERDASCDTAAGVGDGICDACPLLGGVTTEDEMFILVGSYFGAPQPQPDRGN